MEIQAGQWDSSVFQPFFGTLSLFSQLGTLLLSVLVSATHCLSVPLDLPHLSVWPVWLGLLALCLHPNLFDQIP